MQKGCQTWFSWLGLLQSSPAELGFSYCSALRSRKLYRVTQHTALRIAIEGHILRKTMGGYESYLLFFI